MVLLPLMLVSYHCSFIFLISFSKFVWYEEVYSWDHKGYDPISGYASYLITYI